MAFRIKFSSRALREIGEAQEWYELQSPGLGEEFIAAMELQLKRLEQAPLLYAEVIPNVRRALSSRDSLTACFMRYGAISYIFWLCYMMLVIRNVGPKTANIGRYDPKDGGGRIASGTAIESNAGAVADEKYFDNYKTDMANSKAWGKSPVAIEQQALLGLVTHLLMRLFLHN